MGILEKPQKILAVTDHRDPVYFWCLDRPDQRERNRTLYLHPLLRAFYGTDHPRNLRFLS